MAGNKFIQVVCQVQVRLKKIGNVLKKGCFDQTNSENCPE